MKKPPSSAVPIDDIQTIQASLENQTRDALLRRLGPMADTSKAIAAERAKARGIGFGVDLIRAILAGRKAQTRRLIRPQPETQPAVDECPAARVGELLYVREPWHKPGDKDASVLYAADGSHDAAIRFKPAMYMPRANARLWLRVTDVRVERLQSITPADLAAEGLPEGASLPQVWDRFYPDAGQRFEDNPWVWVIGFSPST